MHKYYLRISEGNVVTAIFEESTQKIPAAADVLYKESEHPISWNVFPRLRDENGNFKFKWDGEKLVIRDEEERYPLALLKKEKCAEIDRATSAEIAKGFQYSGNTYSLSVEAQLNMLSLRSCRSLFTFPVKYTIQNPPYVAYLNEADVDSFTDAGLSKVKSTKERGTLMKEDVLALTSREDIKNFEISY